MAVALQAVGGTQWAFDDGTPGTVATVGSITVDAGSNRAVVALVAWDLDPGAIVSAIFDVGGANQAMTTIVAPTAATNGTYVAIYGVCAPTADTGLACSVTFTNTRSWDIAVAVFTGVKQTPAAAFIAATPAAATSASPSITIATANGNATLDVTNNASAGNGTSPSQTQIFSHSGLTSTNPSASYGLATTGSNVHSWTIPGSVAWVSAGVNVVDVNAEEGGDDLSVTLQDPVIGGSVF